MAELISANWVLLVIALLIGILVAWWVFARSRKTKVQIEQDDAGPEQRSKRNQALINAAPAAPIPAPDAAQPIPVASDAPISAAPSQPSSQPSAEPATTSPKPAPPPTPASALGADDLTMIKGVGPKLSEQLRNLGVTSFAQISAWDDAEIDRIDGQLGRFQGRIRRDNWPEQARLLASGNTSGYEGKFGKL